MESVLDKIKKERKKRSLTQQDIAKMVGVCYVSICNLEQGRNVGIKLIEKVCDVLNLQIIAKERE